MEKSKHIKAFTLTEVLVYVAVLVILLTTIFSLFLWLVRSNMKTKVIRETLDSANRSISIIVNEIKEAKSVYVPTTTSLQLSLETTKYLPENESATYIDFYLCGTQICLKKESQNPIPLTSDNVEVKNLTFTKIISGSSTSYQVYLKIDYKNPSGRPEYNSSVELTSTASLRSY